MSSRNFNVLMATPIIDTKANGGRIRAGRDIYASVVAKYFELTIAVTVLPKKMWYLTSATDQRILYVLPNVDITIGRSVDAQVCNFAIPDDPSISRKHAVLSVSSNSLFLQDLGSRYGTFINDTQKLEPNMKTQVNNNDVIKFGKMGSVWTVHEVNFTTCTSTLKGENLQNLKLCLGKLGAILKNEWDDSCTYLTMPAITLTIKVVLALAQGSLIVTPEYWTKCMEAVNRQSALPDPNMFTPQVVESTLNKENVSFLPDERRKSLFAGKTFVFFSRRQMEMYKAVLLKCSASPVLLSETKLTKSTLCDYNVVVIQYNLTTTSQETQTQKDQINDIVSYIKTKGKRVITDAEIGLALLYCSTEKYCNPDFCFSSEVIKQAPNNPKSAHVLAPESQEPHNVQQRKDNVIINETLTPGSHKRKMSEENDFEANANKKLATSVASASNNEGGKRKLSDDSDVTSNAKKMAVDNDDDMFQFLRFNKGSENNNTEKKSLFSKPGKRKADNTGNAEEDLFNFIPDKRQDTGKEDSSKSSIFDNNRADKNEEDDLEAEVIPKRISTQDEKIDVSALRGAKLKELMELNANLNFEENLVKTIKKEDPDDLDQKMQDLDLGTTIVTIRADLIKREPIQINESNETNNGSLKNFKKFKKVWPVKTQVNKISRSYLNNAESDLSNAPEITSQSY